LAKKGKQTKLTIEQLEREIEALKKVNGGKLSKEDLMKLLA
jgi:hypothetical protein